MPTLYKKYRLHILFTQKVPTVLLGGGILIGCMFDLDAALIGLPIDWNVKKITAFVGSVRKKATYKAVQEFEKNLKRHEDIDFEYVFLSDLKCTL